MSKRVAVRHTIEQQFDKAVRLSTHWLRLRPAPQARTKVSAYSLSIDAGDYFVNWVRDPYQNYLVRLDTSDALGTLRLDVEYIAELEPMNPFDFVVEPDAIDHPFEYAAQQRKELAPFLTVAKPGPRLAAWLRATGEEKLNTIERLSEVTAWVQENIALSPTTALRAADPETVLERETGTCWDLAWLLTTALRNLGIATRFACGHRIHLVEDLEEADSVSLHCWAEVYLPGAGWVGLDPASGLFADETYIPFAYAPDPLRVVPIVGFREACGEQQNERLSVRRLVSEEDLNAGDTTHWTDIRALGRHVDKDLKEQGLAPSMSMGLSFVSATDPLSAEWHFAALGPSKRQLAETLCTTLQPKLAPGGVMQLGQGEWMAGDSLPRWQLGLYYRADGEPLCEGTRWFGMPGGSAPGPDDAQRFAESIALALGIDPDFVAPAYEDPLGKLLSQNALPRYVPSVEELSDPDRRRELAERLSQDQGAPSGFALPVRCDGVTGTWSSGRWEFRRSRLYLVPGDSPMGYRLPLSGLVHDAQSALESQLEQSPFDDLQPLPDARGPMRARLKRAGAPEASSPAPTAQAAPRMSLCVQARSDGLFLFLPPSTRLEYYLELVAAAEAAAEATGLRVCLEGYPPPDDPRLRRLVLQPDAGVLRVALPQTDSWDERVSLLETVYADAWLAGLSAERITEDGRHLPPGGGVRTTVGGATPDQSPFLCRPTLLRDLIAYFQRHPSLSYFFAGRGIGSSGVGPRPDEGRDEAVYELSIALEHLSDAHHRGLPWYADRVLNNLLTDPSGDPKRAEIRVDELYHPDRASLRQGRIHIGSFETAPDARTASLQSLLVLGLLGRFAKKPSGAHLERWDTALLDQWMLPDVLWEDLRSVVGDLQEVGYPMQLEWFEALRALRFPVLGTTLIGDVTLQLRTALEPLPLLAEQASGSGMARFIDVANERLQVRLEGLAPERYVLVCNGRPVPLKRMATHGEYLAGVRYKVTNPPSTLHPTISPVDALVFDLIDTWSTDGRAIGGCTYIPPRIQYHFGPGGPVAAPQRQAFRARGSHPQELEARYAAAPWRTLPQRIVSRYGGFFPWGSGMGPMKAPEAHPDGRFPQLLDLALGL